MSQHDYILDNQAGAQFRADLNNALAAVATVNSGASSPTTTYAYQLWADTTTGLLKQRNAANNGWVTLFPLATTVDPSGTIKLYAGASAPTGYLICDGTAVSRTTYADLYTAIGTTFGVGNGTTTFNLPDFRRRVPVGAGGTGTGTLGNALGNTGGAETHTLAISEMPLHGHPYRASPGSDIGSNTTGGFMVDSDLDQNYSAFTGTPTATMGEQIGGTGGGGAHNNMPPSLVVNYIIKT